MKSGTWKTYTPNDGLAGLRLQHIAEDAAGFLWLATTTNGVSRFDGETFTTFTTRDGLSGNQVYVIEADQRGRLWFGCAGGVSWYDEQGFHRLAPDIWGVDSTITHVSVEPTGRVWFAGFATAESHRILIGYCDDDALQDLSGLYARDCFD